MNWRRIALWTCMVPLPAIGAESSDDIAGRIFAKVSPSVVTIKTIAEDGTPDGQGSGVVVQPDLVATNCHVVRNAESLRVVTASGELPARWLRQHPNQDICLLSVAGLALTPVRTRASGTPAIGESVFAVGNPLGFGLAVSAGLLAATETVKTRRVLVSTAVLSPGSSGGGLFDQEGRLIGITTAVLGIGQGLNLSLSADALEDLIAHGSPPPARPTVPSPEPRWNDLAVELQKSGDWSGLEKHAQEWHRAQPTAANALVYQGIALSRLNRHREAETALRQALVLDADSAFAWRALATALHTLGRQEDRDQALKEADHRQPGDPQSSLLRAEWSQQQGNPDEAYRQVMECLRRGGGPAIAAAWRLLGVIETARGHGDAATHAFRVALRLENSQLPSPTSAAGVAADAPIPPKTADTDAATIRQAETYRAIGVAEFDQGRFGPAEDALRKAVGLAPGLAGAWNSLGNVLFKTNRLEDAEVAYDKAIGLAPTDADLLVNRASLRRGRHQLDRAMEDVRRAIALAPDLHRAWREYGATALQAGDFRSACMAFGKLDGNGQASADDLVSLGECLLATDQIEAALKALQRAEAKNPKLVRMYLTMAKVLGAKGDVQAALDYENRAIEIDPTNISAWSGKGYALLKLGKLTEAVSTLETTVRLDPRFSNAWINLGEAQLRSRNIAQAINALEKAIVLTPGALDARLFLAQAYLTARLPGKSRGQIEHVLEKQPNHVPALAMLTMSYLLEGNEATASTAYLRLKKQAPDAAKNLRAQAINGRLSAASRLPE
jgi:tetratricopeptide (TPR) repeat protein